MGISALLNLSEVDIHCLYLWILQPVLYVYYLQVFAFPYHCDIAIFEIHHLVCVFYDGRRVGTQKELIVANAYNQRALFACCYDLVWGALVQQSYGVCSNHFVQGQLNSRQ